MTGRTLRLTGKRTVVTAFAFVSAVSFLVAAVPPANDTCASAVVIPAAGPFPYLAPVVPDVTGATTTGDPPTASCYFGAVSRSIWYRFTPSSGGLYVLSLNDTATTVLDTLMAVYTSSGGCNGPFVEVGCDDDQGFNQSAIATTLTASTPYYIVVWVVTTNAPLTGETAIQLKVSRPPVLTNDTCAGAEIIPASGPFPYASSTNETLRASNAGDPPITTCPSGGTNSVWFRFTPAVTGGYVFTTCDPSATRIFDTLMVIYRSSTGCTGPFTQVACNNDTCDLRASITTNLTAGTTYYIVVWNQEDAQRGYTTLQLKVGRASAPAVTTLGATSITATSAVLNSLTTPNGLLTRTWFDWGTTTNYGNRTTARSVGSGIDGVATNASIAGLSPGTLYHYRAVATNTLGAVVGADQTFATRIQIASIERLGNGSYRIRFSGLAGLTYRVEGSTNLTSWSDLGTATALGGGAFEFIDVNAVNFQRRFYRINGP